MGRSGGEPPGRIARLDGRALLVHLPLLVASPLAVELAIVHNYFLNDRWTFRRRQASRARFAMFNLSAMVALWARLARICQHI